MAASVAYDLGNSVPELTFKCIREVVEDDMSRVEASICNNVASPIPTVEDVSGHLVDAGGKRLRPLIVLLTAHACGYKGSKHIELATLMEFLHSATLLHDDVIDSSLLRRGRDTANALWGNSASILVGDFLYSRAFQLMVNVNSMSIMKILGDATNTIAEGEVMQLENTSNADMSESRYSEIIYRKSALLFEASAHTAAVLAGVNEARVESTKDFGHYFGMAFQIIDDMLDYVGRRTEMGKNVGDDLTEGKPTLPLLLAIKHSHSVEAKVIRDAIQSRSADALQDVIAIVNKSGVLKEVRERAENYSRLALQALQNFPIGPHREALESLTKFALHRTG